MRGTEEAYKIKKNMNKYKEQIANQENEAQI